MGEYAVLGKRLPKKDAKEKVCGQAKYTGDLVFKNMLCGKILRSPYPHARILNIDTSKALKLKGVKAVVTGKDITDIPHGIVRVSNAPPWLRDKFAIAKDKVRYMGDEVAAVAATDELIAEEALDLIKVEYEELPAVFDVFEAMKPGAPKIHDHAEANVSLKVRFDFGDVEKGFSESDFVMNEHFETRYVCHAPLETHTAIADFSQSGDVALWLSTQVPFYDQVAVAEALGMPVSKVRIIKPHVGGGFGGKAETHSIFVISAVLSRAAGLPVKMVHTREEEIACTSLRHPTFIDQKVGVKKDGAIMAVESIFLTEGGAYNSYGPATLFLHGGMQNGPYKIKNFRYDGTRIYTNKTVSGAQRGHGGIQPRFAMESLMDMIAEKLDLDPLEIRIKNGLEVGDVTLNGATINSSGHVESIVKAQKEIGWKDKRGKLPDGQGVGIACNFFVSGAAFTPYFDHPESHSAVVIDAHEDGMFTLLTGTADIGQGSMTVLAQIVAEEVGVNLDDVNVIAGDTGCTPMDLGSFSSRVTVFAGNATKNAASEMKKILLAVAAVKLEANPHDLDARGGRINIKGNPDKGITVSETIKAYLAYKKEPLTTKGHYNPPGDDEAEFRLDNGKVNLTPAWTFGAHAAEVEVDKETGMVTVKRVVAAHDCGFAINPMSVEGQIEGGVSMAFGQALLEEVQVKKGTTLNPSFLGYTLPTAMDNPPTTPIIVEANDKEGPYGAKEASEGVLIPVIPCIANAIYDAIGVRIKDLPITPEKILKGLKERDRV